MAGLKHCQIIQRLGSSLSYVYCLYLCLYLGSTLRGLMSLYQLICSITFLRSELFNFHFQNLPYTYWSTAVCSIVTDFWTCSDAQSAPVIPHVKCLTELFQYCDECVSSRRSWLINLCRSAWQILGTRLFWHSIFKSNDFIEEEIKSRLKSENACYHLVQTSSLLSKYIKIRYTEP